MDLFIKQGFDDGITVAGKDGGTKFVEPAESKARQKEKYDGAWREVNRRSPFYRKILIKHLLKQALKGTELREMSKSVLVKIFESERLIFLEIGRRLTERGILLENRYLL